MSALSSRELQTELGTAGEHAVGLGHALGGQVVDQHAQVGDVSAWRPRAAHVVGQAFSLAALKRCVDTGEQALRRRLFVPCGAVDLSGKEQAADLRASRSYA
jgi:hypothetical protein